MKFNYTDEKNILILLSLLKQMGIRKIVASPGTTNFSLIGSMQSDPYFEIYSSVDERSAAYIACGLAAESGEPVMLSCTGATASRNYYPGLTEAYYRKLPVLAITSHQGVDRIGQLIPQNVDRRNLPNDIACISVHIPIVNNDTDFEYARVEINKALLELYRNGGGPAHINMTTMYSRNFDTVELPDVKCMRRLFAWDSLPVISQGKIGVYVGSHRKFSERETAAIDGFCATHNAVVFCDHTSGYYGKYKILPTLALMQNYGERPIGKLDLMIHIGEISAATFAGLITAKEIWRVNPDGEIRDPFKSLVKVFQMSEESFFERYSVDGADNIAFLEECQESFSQIYKSIPELPFSNIWIAQNLSSNLPENCLFHISASHSRRAWNIFPLPKGVESMCNVGVCGIDGCTSTLVGASFADVERICFLVTGDLAFFYDLNVLGNRHVGKNIRILLINNGIGGEFKLNGHPCCIYGDKANLYMAAEGHFGHKSPKIVKDIATDWGFEYMTASSKDEFLDLMPRFVNNKIGNKSIIFEVFTDYVLEDEALKLIKHIDVDKTEQIKDITKGITKDLAKGILGNKGLKLAKKIIGR